MIQSLIPKTSFLGLDNVAHLATGGESPMLQSHAAAVQQFMLDKSQGEPARGLQDDMLEQAAARCASLFKVPVHDLTFLSSASDGINVLRYALEWQAGDNVVVADVEFPSDILPWTTLQSQGVEVRIVRHRDWVIEEDDVLARVDERTRVVAISQVSMFTGQHMDVPKLSKAIRDKGAIFLLDATHAAGVVPVDASYADIMVCSCYKWLLGTHGAAVFYCNRQTMGSLSPPFLGWASPVSSGGWQSPLEFKLSGNADRFLAANPSYISLHVLNNGLKELQALGEERIRDHCLQLSKMAHEGIAALGLEMMTPVDDARRAGNTCFMVDNVEALRATLGEKGVLVWGAYGNFGRIRVSAHVHNDSADIERLLQAMRDWKTAV